MIGLGFHLFINIYYLANRNSTIWRIMLEKQVYYRS